MVKERQDITGSNCLKVSFKVIVDKKGVKDSWKKYMCMCWGKGRYAPRFSIKSFAICDCHGTLSREFSVALQWKL